MIAQLFNVMPLYLSSCHGFCLLHKLLPQYLDILFLLFGSYTIYHGIWAFDVRIAFLGHHDSAEKEQKGLAVILMRLA